MKKITILAAFALMTTAAFAQTSRQIFIPYSSEDGMYNWSGNNWIWPTSPMAEPETGSYENNRISLFVDSVMLYPAVDTPQFTISFGQSVQTPGIEITADSVRYNVASTNRTFNITGVGNGVQLVKDGKGAFYTDVDLKNMTTVLKNGTLGRYKKSSAESQVFGRKISVAEGAKATLVMSDENPTKTDYFPALNVDSLVIGKGAVLDFYLPSFGKMRADTTVYVAGEGTINFYTCGNRFFAGGSNASIVLDPATGQWHNGSLTGDNTSKWDKYVTDFSGFEGTVRIQNDVEKNNSTPGVFILAQGPGKANEYLEKSEGDSALYNIWKAANVYGSADKEALLSRLCIDWKDVDLVIGEMGCLACSSTGGATTLFRTRSLNVEPKGHVAGYFKTSEPKLLIITGGDDKDAKLDGTFTACTKGGDTLGGFQIYNGGAGIIKEGKGTYTVTANDNMFALGIDVYEGGVMFDNPDPANNSATGETVTGKPVVICREYGRIGGTGTIGSTTELYGTLYPGDESVSAFRIDGSHGAKPSYKIGIPSTGENGTITKNLANGNEFLKATVKKVPNEATEEPLDSINVASDSTFLRGKTKDAAALWLHNEAAMVFDVNSKDHHDTLLVQGDVWLMEGRNADKKVKISLTSHGEFNLAENDTIVLMHALRAYAGEDDVDFLNGDDFELEVAPEYNGANFKLVTELDTIAKMEEDPKTGRPHKVITPVSWELRAVVTAAGSGTFTPAAIQEPETETETMQVYPNPAVDNVTVALPADVTGTVAIYNLSGQLVKSVSTTEPAVTVNVDDLTAGVYTVRVQTADKSYVQRLVVK